MTVSESVEQQQNRRAGNGNGTVGDMDMFGTDEAGNNQCQNKQGFAEKFFVGDGFLFVYAHDGLFVLFRCLQLFVPEKVKSEDQNNHGDGYNRRQFIDKVHERKLQCRTDENVRWVADESGRAANVGGENF